MSTQTSKLQLVKQANNENWSNDIHNANLQKLDDFAATVDPKKNNIATLASDSTILGLAAGVYQIALSAESSYIPERWGTLIVDRSNVTYGCVMFNSTTGKTYTRHMNGTANWHDSWQQLANNSAVDSLMSRLPNYLKLGREATNATSWSFNVTRNSAGSYSYFLLVGGSSASAGFVYHGFVHVSGNDQVVLTLIGGTAVPGIAGTYNGTTLTITSTNTVYGGMRLIWLS